MKTTIDHSGNYVTEEQMQTQELTMTDRAVQELSSFNKMISAVIPYGELTVSEDGIGKVEEAHKAVKKLNASIEKKRKELKAGALEYGRTVDSIAKQLSEKVDSVEAKLKAERDAFDAIEKAEKAAKEAAKVAAKQKRLDDMVAEGIPVDLAAADLPDEEWMWWFSKAKKAAAEVAEEKRIADEFEAQQRKEREQLAAKMAEETRRQAEELRIRAEEMERQRMADEAALAEQRKAMEAEREELRNQQEAIAREKALRQAEAEAAAAELRRKEQEAEQARKAALVAPELEKLETVLKAMAEAASLKLDELGEPAWGFELIDQFLVFSKMINQRVSESVR
jgi:DNA repair exonuclease SbcCD ATPase subunit